MLESLILFTKGGLILYQFNSQPSLVKAQVRHSDGVPRFLSNPNETTFHPSLTILYIYLFIYLFIYLCVGLLICVCVGWFMFQ